MVIFVHLRTLPPLISLLLIVSLLPAAAAAQSSGDPAAGSPPSAVYQIPLAKGRTDAAPHRKDSGASNTDASGSKGGSLYRSENNFGSSSQVPGSAGADSNNSADPNNSNSADPNNSNGGGPGVTGDSSLPSADVDSGGTSLPGSLGLLALIVVAGVGIGYIALRARRLGR
jgi:hypothetical protein